MKEKLQLCFKTLFVIYFAQPNYSSLRGTNIFIKLKANFITWKPFPPAV
jgi:hypothetical protein